MTSPARSPAPPATSHTPQTSAAFITPEALREHWQGHRRLTRRVIAAFPDEQLFTHSVGGMRSFGELAVEIVRMAVPSLHGAATGEWKSMEEMFGGRPAPTSRAALLAEWDETTAEIDRLWPTIPAERFQAHDVAFGQWPGPIHALLLYVIDNEVHHRAQGYVYLRALGMEPPPFYDRS